MGRLLLSIILIATSFCVQAQSGSVRGRIVDTSSKKPLPDATIGIIAGKDSSLVSFTMSAKDGSFEIKNLNAGEYVAVISLTGFGEITRKFVLNQQKMSVDLGELIATTKYTTLDEVTVTDIAPIKIKDDTISFRADAFKTKPNATAEDLLKRLPGVQVQKDGTVSAMGETVQKVYVDGKEFFGNDPKLATKNITAEMVDQVQIFDDMSEQSKFTKIDDGSKSKAINLKLKKDRNKGYFGKATVGAGNEKRYEGNLSFNKFKGDRRISVLASANNTNKQGFSFTDMLSSMGGFGPLMKLGMMGGSPFGLSAGVPFQSGGNSSGITDSKFAGVNYNDQWGRVDFQSNYFFSLSNNRGTQSSYRQTYFPGDSTTETFSDNISSNKNKNHKLNARWEYAMDSSSSVLYSINLNLQRSDNLYNDTSFTYSDAINDYLATTSRTSNQSERDGINYNGELLLRKKFRKPGRTITLGWRMGFNENEGESFNNSPFIFFKPDGDIFFARSQDYVSGQAGRSNNNTLSTSYTEPLSASSVIEFNYAYSHNKNTSDKRTYDFNSGSGKYDIQNLLLTNYFANTNISSRLGANYRFKQKNYNYQLGLGVQITQLGSHSIQASVINDTTIRQRFTNFFPTAILNITKNKAKNLQFSYRGRTNAPTASQLQDVPDVTNPLQVRIGNPSLKQEFGHNLSFNFSKFNIMTFRFLAANIGVSTTDNKIVNSTDSLNQATTITRPVNMDGSFSTNAFISLGMPIKKLKGSNLNLTTIGSYFRDVSELYKRSNNTTRLMVMQSFGFNYDHKDRLNIGLNGSVTFNKAGYSLQDELNNEYFTQMYSVDLSYSFTKKFIASTDFDYFINSGRTEGFNQSVPMWNASISHQLLKNNVGELKFSIYDLLNRNQSINRTIGDNYFIDTRSNVLGRYFILSFTYSLNKMGGKSQMPAGIQKMIERGAKQFGLQ